jgi:hypothetical protein
MLTVFKYPFAMDDAFEIKMPHGAEILCVQVQHGQPCMWAKVETAHEEKPRHFRLAGTGHPLGDGAASMAYIDTFQLHGGSLVFHLFEAVPS